MKRRFAILIAAVLFCARPSVGAHLLMPAAATDAPAVKLSHPEVIGVGAGGFLIELPNPDSSLRGPADIKA
jgi:hypothetical protein